MKTIKKKPWIIGNLKMNMKIKEILQYIKVLDQKLSKENIANANIILTPPFTLLKYVAHLLKDINLNIHIGSQNFFYEENGPYTGEISIGMLKDLNIDYTLVGHSERRIHFSETDEMIQKKVQAALFHNISPILCIGENIQDRTLDLTEEKLSTQLKIILNPLKNNIDLSKICIAYEPIWAIGLRGYLDIETIQVSIKQIKNILYKIGLEESLIENIPILYGGAIYEENIENIVRSLSIDGVLIGRASLDPEKFIKCINLFMKDYYS